MHRSLYLPSKIYVLKLWNPPKLHYQPGPNCLDTLADWGISVSNHPSVTCISLNAPSMISKIPKIVQNFNVQSHSQTEGKLSIVNFWNNKRITDLQYTKTKSKYSHSKWEQWGHSKEKPDQSKIGNSTVQIPNLEAPCSIFVSFHGSIWMVTGLESRCLFPLTACSTCRQFLGWVL